MMPGFRLYMAVPIVALALPCPAFAAHRVIPSWPQRQWMSPVDRRVAVLVDLNAVLTGPAGNNTIATQPYLSDKGGLCRREVIDLVYAPAGERKDWNGPLKPKTIRSVSSQYHFLGAASRSAASWEKACAQLPGDTVYWASGDNNDGRASDALATLEIAVNAARKDQGIKIDCTDLGETKDVDCSAKFVAAAAKIIGFGTCYDQPVNCDAFASGQYEFSVRSDWSDGKRSITIKMSTPDVVVT